MNQENDDWVARLQPTHPDREQAIGELTALLRRGSQRSLTKRYGGNVAPEDVAQEAVLKILDSLDTFEGRSKFTTWAMTIATRIGISELRRKYYQNVSLDAISAGENRPIDFTVDDAESVEVKEDRKDLVELMMRLIEERLSDKQQFAIRATLEGLPVEEIARKTDSNRNAIYKLVHDARQQLKAGFIEAGIEPTDIQAVIA